ncbi:MAG: hypothetical protein ACLRMJ_11455 [Alistipes finegoldii]
MASAADLNSVDIVRRERRKELAFENQTIGTSAAGASSTTSRIPRAIVS